MSRRRGDVDRAGDGALGEFPSAAASARRRWAAGAAGIALVAGALAAVWRGGRGRDPGADRAALIALERTWLAAGDAATVAPILADDFVHVLPSGSFVTKAQQLAWMAAHPRPAAIRRFGGLRVRLYQDVGLVTGTVIAQDPSGREQRTVFTDVFAYRHGRWQAVNAQENRVAPR